MKPNKGKSFLQAEAVGSSSGARGLATGLAWGVISSCLCCSELLGPSSSSPGGNCPMGVLWTVWHKFSFRVSAAAEHQFVSKAYQKLVCCFLWLTNWASAATFLFRDFTVLVSDCSDLIILLWETSFLITNVFRLRNSLLLISVLCVETCWYANLVQKQNKTANKNSRTQ